MVRKDEVKSKRAARRDREIQALRERLSRLSEASLRINESLDFDTVVQGVLDSARSLTGASYGVMTFLDDSGCPREFLSSGLTAEEERRIWGLSEGMRLYEYLGNLPSPLRLPDLLAHLRSRGLPEPQLPLSAGPVLSFLAAPIFHRGERTGNLFLGGKEAGGTFTGEDEDTLVLFASQAALVIANARRYREEQRAKTDLEILIDTSPVGIVVFDVRTGAPKSFNREARRIVEDLRNPDQPYEQLLEVVTYRRADGREISLEELPMTQALSVGETVRGEQIVIQVPDGRSVATLINATPIPSEEGEIESYVVTMQDLAHLEELERLRTDFLGTVSHELRVPLTSVLGSANALLNASSELDPAEVRQFHRIIFEQAESMRELIGDLLDAAHIETGRLQIAPEPAEIPAMVDRARNIFLSGGGRDNLHIYLAPDLPLVMADRRRIVQVLGNLLSNAARHSPESSPIRVTAVRQDLHVAVCVADEGQGLSAKQLPHLFRNLTPADPDGGSGRGLAICKGVVEAHGGRIWAESEGPGQGARFTFTIPAVREACDGDSASRCSPNRGKGRSRILVVDDDPQTLRYVRHALSETGFDPIATADPEQVPVLMKQHKPHLVLLDLVLPGFDGLELMKDLLGMNDIPVIFLSGYGGDEIVSRALESGASDYILKPFSPTELVARVRAALRKGEAGTSTESAEPYVSGDLTIDYAERRVTLAGRTLDLTAAEYDLLFELSVNAGRVVTHNQLLRRIWGPAHSGDMRVVRTLVRRLRIKLNDNAANPTYLFVERRVGYRMPKSQEPGQDPG